MEQKNFTKTEKKVYKAVTKIEKDTGKIVSKEPTNFLVVCNAGHMTGATYESIIESFSSYGEIEDVTLVPGKSFSFITFSDIKSAKSAFDDSNGQKCLSALKNPIYISFVNDIPEKFKQSNNWEHKDELPKGLEIHPDFVTEKEENAIIDSLDWSKLSSDLKHRQVLHFGKKFNYGSNTISNDENQVIDPLPQSWTPMLQKSLGLGLQTRLPDQCTVNRYLPGHGIPPHVDNHECCDDTIISLSLLSDVVMNFVDLEDPTKKVHPINLPRRSLMVMKGQARYAFTHGITPRKSDIIPIIASGKVTLTLRPRQERISLTFRKSLNGPCSCDFGQHCPSQTKMEVLDDKVASQLEKLHVHQVYESIADHFSETRHKPWPKVVDFLRQSLCPGAVLVDVGCGNGKYLGQIEDIYQIGLDYSRNLLGFVRDKNCEAVRSDALNLPLNDRVADACISIAVIHHFSTLERRIRAVQEIHRILKINGKGLIYAWAKDQDLNEKPSTYLQQQQTSKQEDFSTDEFATTSLNVKLPVHENRTKFKHNDLLVPWKNKTDTSTLHRFYHVFDQGELEALMKQALGSDKITIDSLYYDQGNWCIVFTKLAI